MPSRLAGESSPYLRQHADNPVDWWPWGAEAFAEARRLDKPVFVSIGYAACHWCHVMAHESFEDDDTARLMNERLVNAIRPCVRISRSRRLRTHVGVRVVLAQNANAGRSERAGSRTR